MRSSGIRALVAAVVSLCLVSSACGAQSSNGSQGTADSSAGSIVAAATARLARSYTGTVTSPSTSGPRAVKGKKIYIVACALATPGCAGPAEGAAAAAKAIGWTATVIDGKSDPGLLTRGIETAIAAKADGIVAVGVDCALGKKALQAAKAAGIKTVALYAFDCDQTTPGAAPVYDASLNVGFPNLKDFLYAWSAARADWAIVHTQGRAKIIQFSEGDFLVPKYIDRGFVAAINRNCQTCQIVDTIPITLQDVISGAVAQKLQSALLAHPEANVVDALYDALILTVSQSFVAANRPGVALIGGEGFPPNLDLIRKGVQSVANALPVDMYGWAGVDLMNRVFQGDNSNPPSGFGWQIIDKNHNLPGSGGYVPAIDYKAIYRKIWGVSG